MIGIIGGSSLKSLKQMVIQKKEVVRTPFGIPSSPIILGTLFGAPIAFLARHGVQHTIPPHLINYRANIWALHHVGCQEIYAFSAMCSINDNISVKDIVIPDQLIDYTWDRKSTFFNSQIETVQYTEFLEPYSSQARQKLIHAASEQSQPYHDNATYAITQGPRYETRAEIERYQRDGCHVIGMTGMPEASLAQEIQADYAVCGLVTNVNTGNQQISHREIIANLNQTDQVFDGLLSALLTQPA
ncbi:S-methyl-5'-thioinosine phosphorylase [Ostreibacterium oceani]|uniref:Purine nucleoside phosphorylase n=1 Tax=Ostreibacterium oceani TaxID=2654998 RepID=A0A6N7EQY7_9GAMM|nr:S-methyl-5'-thioinosine phosphorylase [Ostreibacterium oceani]MPV85274.1 S-methyl-5'-thioinosine phosphorylase [Ostreibacterium oceani]